MGLLEIWVLGFVLTYAWIIFAVKPDIGVFFTIVFSALWFGTIPAALMLYMLDNGEYGD